MAKRYKATTPGDSFMEDPRPTDVVIPIMGATGAGKSTFINLLLETITHRRPRVKIGDQLASCTFDLESVVIEAEATRGRAPTVNRNDQYRIVIVDTPGFDDTTASDFEILKRIARWLEESFRRNMILGGVIYLHDISQDRFSGTARRNLDMFSHLCGEAALDKVVLVTSKWSRQGDRNFETREKELKAVHWKEMLHPPNDKVGARVMRLGGPSQTTKAEGDYAWEVVHSILKRLDRRLARGEMEKTLAEVLQIQDELVKRRKGIPQTEAARELREQLQAALRVQEEMLALEAQAADGDQEAEAKIKEKEIELRKMHDAIQQNKESFFARFAFWRRWFR